MLEEIPTVPLESVTAVHSGVGSVGEDTVASDEIVPVAPETLYVESCTVIPPLEAKLSKLSASLAETPILPSEANDPASWLMAPAGKTTHWDGVPAVTVMNGRVE